MDATEQETPKPKGLGLPVLAACVCLGAGLGYGGAQLLPRVASGTTEVAAVGADAGHAPAAHGSDSQGAGHGETEDGKSDLAFLSFGEVIVNLNEGRLNRYLRTKVTLQVDAKDSEEVQAKLDERSAILRNWLLSHLSDKESNEIRGTAGLNMLRREIQDHFNTVLFPDGYDRVRDVLFEEFNIQ